MIFYKNLSHLDTFIFLSKKFTAAISLYLPSKCQVSKHNHQSAHNPCVHSTHQLLSGLDHLACKVSNSTFQHQSDAVVVWKSPMQPIQNWKQHKFRVIHVPSNSINLEHTKFAKIASFNTPIAKHQNREVTPSSLSNSIYYLEMAITTIRKIHRLFYSIKGKHLEHTWTSRHAPNVPQGQAPKSTPSDKMCTSIPHGSVHQFFLANYNQTLAWL